MIFLMDFKGDALARQFQRSRRALGLSLDTPYFNAGLMAIDRAAWRARKAHGAGDESASRRAGALPLHGAGRAQRDARGGFAPLSPRYNFMGDFFLLDLERRIEPIVLHFVNSPKPWELAVAGRSAFRRRLPRLVRRIALARLGEDARSAGVAPDPAAATRLRQDFAKASLIYRAGVIY